jgi:hypothetical protein
LRDGAAEHHEPAFAQSPLRRSLQSVVKPNKPLKATVLIVPERQQRELAANHFDLTNAHSRHLSGAARASPIVNADRKSFRLLTI